jgi:hypothetical protein
MSSRRGNGQYVSAQGKTCLLYSVLTTYRDVVLFEDSRNDEPRGHVVMQAWPQTYSFPGRAPDPANPSAPLPGEAPGRFSLPGGNTTGQLRAVWDTPLGKAAVACIAIGSFMTVSMLGCCV